MSTLETNAIGKYSGNNISVDDALNLKSYTEAQRDALTASAGDVVYNSDNGTIDFYNGTAWFSTSGSTFAFTVDFLVIAGGGSGGFGRGAGGGAGGYRNSYLSETSGGNSTSETALLISKNTNYTVTVGAGGVFVSGNGVDGNNSVFASVTSTGGGFGAVGLSSGQAGGTGGSGGGGSGVNGTPGNGGVGISGQGKDGGRGGNSGEGYSGGGGGGASAAGTDAGSGGGVAGGNGLASSITGSSVTRAGGGGSGAYDTFGSGGAGGSGGGGAGGKGTASTTVAATAGTANTGGGGGGGGNALGGANGGSGVVIIRYATADATISVGAGLTSSSATDGSDTVVTFTAGTGTVSFA